MFIACFCDHVFETTRSTACPECGEPIFTRERYETPGEFQERMASHLRTLEEIRALRETAHPAVT
jgi:DNA-directed RNA polymerase subunit RPC12/RpoP